jgi:hypothetical protein
MRRRHLADQHAAGIHQLSGVFGMKKRITKRSSASNAVTIGIALGDQWGD